ncbi:amidohydrolase family protein [Aureimonas fodinaquatilis]|uniref:Amidohydrolase family protein n=1 Tax=Aureimonas fodinaquatilis TaxID=2565783 RepID=A0A5B0DV34_9HYPH|nr:amidohydrolase family protein [Aureimonas fodinaquatilis]KAA0969059.1 amidohydrolase family protein [Aureimonas fodinaquatilis]
MAAASIGKGLAIANPNRRVRLTNVRIFNGHSPDLLSGRDILIEGGQIADLIAADAVVNDADHVDCAGGVAMPGMIDAHWHSFLAALPQTVAMSADAGYLHLLATQQAEATLMRGFTTVRDLGGPAFALKRAIDERRFVGPRIYPSGAMISQTSGHGDFRPRFEGAHTAMTPLSPAEEIGISIISDGVPDMLRRTREQLLQGASQIKVMVGGGVSSRFDPLDTMQFTPDEIRAAVDAARDWGTYVCAHVYTPEGIARALDCGILSIEHGQLADAEAARRMADAGAWWSLQPFLADEDANPQASEAAQAQQRIIAQGTVRAFELAQRFNVKTAVGTDILFSPAKAATQGRQIAKIARFMSPVDVLRLVTGANAELLAMSGQRNPYPGRLGVIEKGALADLIVLNGNPLEDIELIGQPDRIALIMKDGAIHKNELAQ